MTNPKLTIRKNNIIPPTYQSIENLKKAYERIKSNPANYGPTWKETLNLIDEEWFRKTSEELINGTWMPTPVKRVKIPKIKKGLGRINIQDSGKPGSPLKLFEPPKGGPSRPLGVPNPRDKIVQEALREHVEMIFQPSMSSQSFAYQKGKGVADAIIELKIAKGMRKLIEGDISKYFDTINHEKLLNMLDEKLDGHTVELIERILTAGIFDENDRWRPTLCGVPQGGVISPLLANIYLTPFDKFVTEKLTEKYPELKIKYVRYADDWIIAIDGQGRAASRIKWWCEKYLREELLLTLNKEKTVITATREGGNFLGFKITRKLQKGKTRRGNNDELIAILDMKANQTWEKIILRGMLKIEERVRRGYRRKWELRSFVEAAREELGNVRVADNREEIASKLDGLFWTAVMHACKVEGSRNFQKWNEIGVKKYKALEVLADLKKLLYRPYVKREQVKKKRQETALKEECEGKTHRCVEKIGAYWNLKKTLRVQAVGRMPLRATNLLSKAMKAARRKQLTLCDECAFTMITI